MIRHITNDELARYRADGVAKLPGFIDAEQVAAMLVALDEQVANPGRWVTKSHYHSDRAFGLGVPELRDYLLDPVLGENAARAMGSSSARFFFDHMFVFEPNTPVDDHYWHQDLPFWPVDGQHVVSIWLSLVDCTPESSALKFVRGTHTEQRFYPPLGFDGSPMVGDLGELASHAIDVRDLFHEHQAPPFHENPEQHGVIEFSYEAGDAVLFSTRIVHSSGGNRSLTDRRVAYSARYVGDDARLVLRRGVFQDPALLPEEDQPFEIGAPLRSRRYPVVYEAHRK